MSTKQIERLVAEAIALDRQIQTDTETLKGLKADLVVLAEAEGGRGGGRGRWE